jgi:hypothetical protein
MENVQELPLATGDAVFLEGRGELFVDQSINEFEPEPDRARVSHS